MHPDDPNQDEDRPRRRRRDDDEDRPRRRPVDDDDDDEDDRPSRSSRRRYEDERDDFDDVPPRKRSQGVNGMAIAAMIVGIVAAAGALVGWCCCGYFGSGAGVLAGIVAVILGFVARSQGSRSGMGMAGIILGFAAIAIGVIMTILLIIGFAWLQANQGRFAPGGPGGRPGGPGGVQRVK